MMRIEIDLSVITYKLYVVYNIMWHITLPNVG